MARKLRESEGDSLELLLDTICNVFGGIILMAILVILQTQTAAGRVSKLDPADVEDRLEVRRLRFQCDRLNMQIEQLHRRNRILDDSYRAKTSPNVEKLMSRREEFFEAIDLADGAIETIRADRSDADRLVAELERELDNADREAERGRGEAERLARQIRDAVKRLRKKVRLPQRHRPTAVTQVSFLVKGTRAYRLREDCSAKSVGLRGQLYTPKEGAGFELPRKGGVPAGFARELRRFNPRRHFISFWVCGTSISFASFQELRAAAVGKGYEYSVYAYDPAKGLTLYPGGPPVE